MTKMMMMPVVASGWTRGEISARRLSSAPGSGCRTSTGTGVIVPEALGLVTSGPRERVDAASFGLSSSLLRSWSMSAARSKVPLLPVTPRSD